MALRSSSTTCSTGILETSLSPDLCCSSSLLLAGSVVTQAPAKTLQDIVIDMFYGIVHVLHYNSLVMDIDSHAERSFVVSSLKNKDVLLVRQYLAMILRISCPVIVPCCFTIDLISSTCLLRALLKSISKKSSLQSPLFTESSSYRSSWKHRKKKFAVSRSSTPKETISWKQRKKKSIHLRRSALKEIASWK